jgi:mRNA-degrading endonuclease RelE of RelBE toxin-antitoxin system
MTKTAIRTLESAIDFVVAKRGSHRAGEVLKDKISSAIFKLDANPHRAPIFEEYNTLKGQEGVRKFIVGDYTVVISIDELAKLVYIRGVYNRKQNIKYYY